MNPARVPSRLLPLAALAAGAQAQSAYPTKPVTMIVGSAPGGTTDISARMLAEPLGKAFGQTVVVDNRAGASGAIAAVAVKRAEADGHTLLMQYSGYHVITPVVSKQTLGWEAKDLQPVANVLSAPQVVVVRSGLPIKTMADLIAYAKANPGKLTYASSGNGSLQHVDRGDDRAAGGHPDDAHSLQRHRPRAAGPARRPGRSDVRHAAAVHASHSVGQASCAGGHRQDSRFQPSRRSYDRRGRAAEARPDVMVRRVCARRHAEARDRQARRRDCAA